MEARFKIAHVCMCVLVTKLGKLVIREEEEILREVGNRGRYEYEYMKLESRVGIDFGEEGDLLECGGSPRRAWERGMSENNV